MHSPVTAITTTPIEEWIRLATLRPISTDDRRIGSDRNRSMMPFSRSAVMPDRDDERREHDGLRQDARQQELPVGRRRRVVAIDAPKTNANSSTNMIGCIVTSLSISGIRLVWIMLRFTMIHDCCAMFVRRVAGPVRRSRAALLRDDGHALDLLGFVVLGAVAGQRQEHVVEARPRQADVVDVDRRCRAASPRPGSCRPGRRRPR